VLHANEGEGREEMMQDRTEREDIDRLPEFSVIFTGDTMEPIADVVPEGDVTFVLANDSAEPHAFALAKVESHEHDRVRRAIRFEPDDPTLVGHVDDIEPGEAVRLTYRLERGRYVLLSNTPGDFLGRSLFELTVQPEDGSDRTS
jgi:hypothetical protein